MRILLVMLLALVQANTPAPDAPTATIANGQLRASIYLPDAKTGYYRGARFDWSGQVSSLTWNGPRVLRAVVRAVRPDPPRRDPGPGRGVPDRRHRARLRRGGARRHLRPHRHRRAAQAGRGVVPALRPLRDRRPREVDDEDRQGPHRVRPRAEGRHRLRLHLSQDAAARRRHAGHRARAEEHRHQADRDQRLQPQLLHARRQDDRAGQRGPLPVRAEGGAPAERHGRDARPRDWPSPATSSRRRTSSPSSRDSGPRRRTMASRWRTAPPARASASPATGRCRSCCSGRPTRRCAPSRTSTPASSPAAPPRGGITYTFYEAKAGTPAPR